MEPPWLTQRVRNKREKSLYPPCCHPDRRERENKRERGAEPGECEGEGEGEARHPLSRPSACGVWSPEVQR